MVVTATREVPEAAVVAVAKEVAVAKAAAGWAQAGKAGRRGRCDNLGRVAAMREAGVRPAAETGNPSRRDATRSQ
jgi:hypothetical protein